MSVVTFVTCLWLICASDAVLRLLLPVQRGWRSIGKMLGDEPTRIVSTISKPCLRYKEVFSVFEDQRYAGRCSRSHWRRPCRSSVAPHPLFRFNTSTPISDRYQCGSVGRYCSVISKARPTSACFLPATLSARTASSGPSSPRTPGGSQSATPWPSLVHCAAPASNELAPRA